MTQSRQIEFPFISDLSQEEILEASPANGIYNDPWGVHSRQVCPDMSRCHGFKPNHNCPPPLTARPALLYVLT